MCNSAGGKHVVTRSVWFSEDQHPIQLMSWAACLMAHSHKVYNLAVLWASWIWKKRCVSPPPHKGQNLLPSWSTTSTTAASHYSHLATDKQIWESPAMHSVPVNRGTVIFVRLNGHWGLVLCLWQWLHSSSEQDARVPYGGDRPKWFGRRGSFFPPHAVSGRPCKYILVGNRRLKK